MPTDLTTTTTTSSSFSIDAVQFDQLVTSINDIRIFLNVFLVLLGITISFFVARWIWKSLILSYIRGFIKLKL